MGSACCLFRVAPQSLVFGFTVTPLRLDAEKILCTCTKAMERTLPPPLLRLFPLARRSGPTRCSSGRRSAAMSLLTRSCACSRASSLLHSLSVGRFPFPLWRNSLFRLTACFLSVRHAIAISAPPLYCRCRTAAADPTTNLGRVTGATLEPCGRMPAHGLQTHCCS